MESGNNPLASLGQSFAIILAFLAILLNFLSSYLWSMLGFLLGVIALVIALLSSENQPLTYKSKAAIILSIIGIVLSMIFSAYFEIIYGW